MHVESADTVRPSEPRRCIEYRRTVHADSAGNTRPKNNSFCSNFSERYVQGNLVCLEQTASVFKCSERSKKEVFQPHLPVRLPCYDLAPITGFALDRSLRSRSSGTHGFHGLTGGVYKARERIHRAMADARLLANPASWSRVADSSPN